MADHDDDQHDHQADVFFDFFVTRFISISLTCAGPVTGRRLRRAFCAGATVFQTL